MTAKFARMHCHILFNALEQQKLFKETGSGITQHRGQRFHFRLTLGRNCHALKGCPNLYKSHSVHHRLFPVNLFPSIFLNKVKINSHAVSQKQSYKPASLFKVWIIKWHTIRYEYISKQSSLGSS